MENRGNEGNRLPKIIRGHLKELKLYEISEAQLERLEELEKSAADPACLAFAIFLLSIFLSYLSMLVVNPIKSQIIFTIFVVIDVCAFIGGVALVCKWLTGWRKTRRSISRLLDRIRNQIPPEGIQETDVPTDEGTP